MAILLHQVRISYVFSSVVPGLAAPPKRAVIVPGFLTPVSYDRVFGQARSSATGSPAGTWPGITGAFPLTLPWLGAGSAQGDISNFWYRSLRTRSYRDASSAQAWQAQVPLRPRLPVKVTSAQPSVRVAVEALCHPLANTVTVSLTCRGTDDPRGWAERVAGYERDLRLELADEAGTARSITATASVLLDRLAASRGAWPPGAEDRGTDPFVVISLVEGSGSDEDCALAEGNDVHRFLACLAEREGWAGVARPGPLSEHGLRGRAWRSGGVLFAVDRVRVVWAPYRFRASGRCRWLGCYHHNLTLCSTLVAAWIGNVRWAAEMIRSGSAVTRGFELVERSSRLLAFLYGAQERSDVVYRTRSAAAQIAHSGVCGDLTEVRNYLGHMNELTPIPFNVE